MLEPANSYDNFHKNTSKSNHPIGQLSLAIFIPRVVYGLT